MVIKRTWWGPIGQGLPVDIEELKGALGAMIKAHERGVDCALAIDPALGAPEDLAHALLVQGLDRALPIHYFPDLGDEAANRLIWQAHLEDLRAAYAAEGQGSRAPMILVGGDAPGAQKYLPAGTTHLFAAPPPTGVDMHFAPNPHAPPADPWPVALMMFQAMGFKGVAPATAPMPTANPGASAIEAWALGEMGTTQATVAPSRPRAPLAQWLLDRLDDISARDLLSRALLGPHFTPRLGLGQRPNWGGAEALLEGLGLFATWQGLWGITSPWRAHLIGAADEGLRLRLYDQFAIQLLEAVPGTDLKGALPWILEARSLLDLAGPFALITPASLALARALSGLFEGAGALEMAQSTLQSQCHHPEVPSPCHLAFIDLCDHLSTLYERSHTIDEAQYSLELAVRYSELHHGPSHERVSALNQRRISLLQKMMQAVQAGLTHNH